MSEKNRLRLSWLFVALAVLSAGALLQGGTRADIADDHDAVHDLRHSGDIIPLAQLLGSAELSGLRVLEAKLDSEDGRRVYELELLDEAGHVYERYYDALTGEPLSGHRGD